MKIRTIFMATTMVAALAVASPALAQQGTVITTSGERISGHILDYDPNGFTVDVGGSERRIMRPEIAVVDYDSGARNASASELERLRQGRNLVIMKDGARRIGEIVGFERTMPGKLADLPRSHAHRVKFADEDGSERTFLTSEIARIYFKDPSGVLTEGTQGQAASAGGGPTRITVPANNQWTPTGITVRRGQRVRFESSGRIQLGLGSEDAAQPAGSLTGRNANGAPLPRALAGALIGRIDNGQPFAIGGMTVVQMPAAGQLFLGINDDGFGDNSGEFTVVIDPGSVRR